MKHVILLVEDNEHFADFIRKIIEKEGYQVIWALDAHGADNVINLGIAPSAIVADLRLPGVYNGLDVIAKIKRRSDLYAIPAILITGFPALLDGLVQEKDTRLGYCDVVIEKNPEAHLKLIEELKTRLRG